MVKIAEISL